MHAAIPTPPARPARRATMLAAAAATCCCALTLAGCVGYSGHPEPKPVETLNNPNSVSSKDVSAVALGWVVKRYPPTGEDGRLTMWREFEEAPAGSDAPRLAVNVGQPGVRDGVYNDIARAAGRGAVPLTPESESLPVYHVGRVWVEGDMATVDIFRPVVPWPDGPASIRAYQAITVRLRGGMHPWNVVAHRVWGIGATPPPDLIYYGSSNARPAPQAEPVPEAPPADTTEKFDEIAPAAAPGDADPSR